MKGRVKMEDNEIIELYFARSETAITETDKKYGTYCRTLTYNILCSREDSEECVNDTYMKLWGAIPPQRPVKFCVYIASVARRLALNMRRKMNTMKRGGGMSEAVFDEIAECVASPASVESSADEDELVRVLNDFLAGLDGEKQKMFMKRYYHFYSISDIAEEMHFSEEKVRTTLHRVRGKLKKQLEKEGIEI